MYLSLPFYSKKNVEMHLILFFCFCFFQFEMIPFFSLCDTNVSKMSEYHVTIYYYLLLLLEHFEKKSRKNEKILSFMIFLLTNFDDDFSSMHVELSKSQWVCLFRYGSFFYSDNTERHRNLEYFFRKCVCTISLVVVFVFFAAIVAVVVVVIDVEKIKNAKMCFVSNHSQRAKICFGKFRI